MSSDVGLRHGLDLASLWLWCRPVVTSLIQLLAWEPPYTAGVALKKKKKKKRTENVLRMGMFQAERPENRPGQDEVWGRCQPSDAGPLGHVKDFPFLPLEVLS